MAEKVPIVPSSTSAATDLPQEVDVSAPRRRGKSKVTTVVIVATLLVLAAAAIWYILREPDNSVAAGVAPKPALTLVALDGFTVNLSDSGENHYLRVTLSLGVEHLPAPVSKEKPSSSLPMARIRDTIVAVLTDCKADALLTHDGKLQLKKNLIEALNRETPELGVREIYFTEFLVQR